MIDAVNSMKRLRLLSNLMGEKVSGGGPHRLDNLSIELSSEPVY
jgi:hypothetical protein